MRATKKQRPARSRRVRSSKKKAKLVRKRVKKVLKRSDIYFRVAGVSKNIGVNKRFQWTLVGAVFQALSHDDPKVKKWIEKFEDLNNSPFDGYLVECADVIQALVMKDLRDAAIFAREISEGSIYWFPRDACEELKKEKLN